MFWYRGAGPLLCLHLCLHLTCQATVTCFSGVYNEDVFSSLDWILDQASQRGLRIILPFEVCLRHLSVKFWTLATACSLCHLRQCSIVPAQCHRCSLSVLGTSSISNVNLLKTTQAIC